MNGVLCLDKPAGMTSFQAVARLRRLCGEKKAGHAGTLDPMATGVLPVLLGRATRALDLLPSHDKAYEAAFRPGLVTDTGDITGAVLRRAAPDFSRRQLLEALAACQGRQQQVPPMYSAVKVGGRRLYELAREGRVVERPARTVEFYEIRLLGGPDENGDWHIAARCSGGTYIRTLCEHIGELLGCGATMTALRRTMAAGFPLSRCVTLEQAETLAAQGALQSRVIGLSEVFAGLPAARTTPAQATRFQNGGALSLARLELAPAGTAALFRVLGPDGRLLGLGRLDRVADELRVALNRLDV